MSDGEKTISYTTNFGKQIDIYFKFHKYLDNGNTAIQIFHRDVESGDEPWSFLTVNLDLKLPETHAFIDINNNGGTIVDWLVENGFAEIPIATEGPDFAHILWCILTWIN